MSLYGARAKSEPPGMGARKLAPSVDFDSLWDESSEESEEQAELEASPPQPSLEEAAPKPDKLWMPTKRELMTAQRLHGDSMSEAQMIEYLRRKHASQQNMPSKDSEAPPDSFRGAQKVTHMSSDDFIPKQSSQLWSANAYQGTQAISSADLFPEQRRVGFRETLYNTFEHVVSEIKRSENNFEID